MSNSFQSFLHVASIAVPLLSQGLLATIEISVLAILLAIIIGAILSYFRISSNNALKRISGIYIKIFRCTPFMVDVYLAYYGLPMLGIDVSAFWTGVLILGFYTAAYVAVTLESGFYSVNKGQMESALAIGMSRNYAILRIVFPQTIAVIIPGLTGQFLQTVKDSSILSIITVVELTMMTKEAIGITFSPLFVYLCAAVFYWAINLILEFVSKNTERKHRQSHGF